MERDPISRLLDLCMSLSEKLLDKGYTRAWFSWIEWITITAVLFAVWRKTDSLFILIAAVISILLVFFSGLLAAERIFTDYFGKHTRLKILWLIGAFILMAFIPAVLMEIIGKLISIGK